VLLSDIGLPDERLQAGLARAWRSPVPGTRERLPHRALEQAWLAALAGVAAPPGVPVISHTAMAAGIDLLGVSRDDIYALTHAIACATDFGRWPVAGGVVPAEVLALCESALAIAPDDDDFDLVAKSVMAWPCLATPLSPIADFAFAVLCRTEDLTGILPSLTVPRAAVEPPPPRLRAAYTVITSYHTALVTGLACAMALRTGGAAAGLPSTEPLGADREGWQWEGMTALAPPGLCRDVALNRALRCADFAATREVLAAGVAVGASRSPTALQVAQMLARLGAMAE